MSPTKVLLAEDSGVIRAVLVAQLEEQGYDVEEAEDGQEALERIVANPPDVILLDVEMPRLTGFEVLRALQQMPQLAIIPVVFLTGHGRTEDVVEGLRLGAHDYLRKPVDKPELVARVSAAARVKRLHDELRQRNEELDRVSRIDALTGVHNRRHVEEHLSAATRFARRHRQPLAVMIADIDRFKSINDTLGHAAGDAVLREVAARLAAAVRAEDLLGRWGGEEFVVMMPNTDGPGAAVMAERLRAAVAGSSIAVVGGHTLATSISIGCASSSDAEVDALMHAADTALYAAKEDGRNRVVLAQE